MCDAHAMDVVNRTQYLVENDSCFRLWVEFLFNNSVKELTSLANFGNEIHVLFVDEVFEQL
jgi:hypothetical protein